ncbi:MAG: methyltransferase domain-containing protein [Epsilonproteobacteria bacterium]|nr:methyltransferase domain-containing protein [Campylobacterota bacterium]
MPSNHTNEFSKRAKSYTQHNVIQKKVVKKLINAIDSKPEKILDLGCGSGAVYTLIDWPIYSFIGVDKAPNMCTLHPSNRSIKLYNEDFESLNYNEFEKFDMIISSSALQWAKNLETLFAKISSNTEDVAFAIFCDGTFKTIYEITGLNTFLPNVSYLHRLLNQYFEYQHEVVHYKLDFEDNLSKFRYIKNSGVSGGERKLSYKDTKKLINKYPHDYLEFEVMFVWGKVKR